MGAINRLLIANRGEIAVRIAKTASKLGIETVGIYAENDLSALHTELMDISIHLPGTTLQDTYLNSEKIIEEALRTNSDAVHPGYGFLSENPDFAQAVQDAGLLWVGPTPNQIRNLGDKIIAKKTAIEAGVETTPSYEVIPDGDIPKITMPVIVKASAGGGGRGMRVVKNKKQLKQAIADASREAQSSFNDGRVFIEPFFTNGRHVEVQIFGDDFGNVIHLGERECSVQRRNQKIIEETPSPGLTQETREQICQYAVSLAKHVNYLNAGTVEFLVSDKGQVTFLEVNTRLQVEHPITEAVTGLDLVEIQLKVAEGKPLPIQQNDVHFNGHAIEVRVVAEDPATNWLPSTGTITAFYPDDQMRVDTGIRKGSIITPDYDSLIAKMVTWRTSRSQAIRHMERSLRRTLITGVNTNIPMLIATLNEKDFQKGETQTSYLADHPELVEGFKSESEEEKVLLIASVFALEYFDSSALPHQGIPSGWRNLRTQGQRQIWKSNQELHHVEFFLNNDTATVLLGPWPKPEEDGSLSPDERSTHTVRLINRTATSQIIEVDGRQQTVDVHIDHEIVHAQSRTGSATWEMQPLFTFRDSEQIGDGPVSPLPGTVISVHVKEGQVVQEGDLLMVVEAMKMEHKIIAIGSAKVTTVHFQENDRVNTGELLVTLEKEN